MWRTSSTSCVDRKEPSSSSSWARTSPQNWVEIRSSATISELSTQYRRLRSPASSPAQSAPSRVRSMSWAAQCARSQSKYSSRGPLRLKASGVALITAGTVALTIAEPACSCTRCVSRISNSSNPASLRPRSNSAGVSAPPMHPDHCSMSRRTDSGMSASATMSVTANRPPGRNTRAASLNTRDLLAERLITQLLMITSTESSGRGMSSIVPFGGIPRSRSLPLRWLLRANSSISSVMSRPYALPLSPTR